MAQILHIDTSTDAGVVAISSNGTIMAQEQTASARDHAANINSMVDAVLAKAGISLSQLDAVAVCGGPGSYTGLRIGMATAKGICYALSKLLLVDNKLTLMALQARNLHSEYNQYIALLPARENEYFVAIYDKNGDELVAPAHHTAEALKTILPVDNQHVLITGEVLTGIKEIYSSSKNKIVTSQTIDLQHWATYAETALRLGMHADTVLAAPFYLKDVFIQKPKPSL